MTDLFTSGPLLPQINPVGDIVGRTRSAQFGDGYSQDTADGLNPVTETWPVVYEGYSSDISAIKAFLVAHIGISFYWTPPLGIQGYYQCLHFPITPLGADIYQINPTFMQRFKP